MTRAAGGAITECEYARVWDACVVVAAFMPVLLGILCDNINRVSGVVYDPTALAAVDTRV